MKNLATVIITIFSINTFSYSNVSEVGVPVNIVVSLRLPDASLLVYPPFTNIKGELKEIKDATCITVLGLLESIQSANNQIWLDHNYLSGKSRPVSKKALEYRNNQDKNKNYKQLVHTLYFQHNGIEMSISKFWFVDNGKKSVMGTLVAQKKNGRWYRGTIPSLDYLSAVIGRIKSKVLQSLIRGENIDGVRIGQLIEKTKSKDGSLDFDKLYQEIELLSKAKKWDELFRIIDKNNP